VSGDSQSSFAAIALWVIARAMRWLDPRIPILVRSACINEMAGTEASEATPFFERLCQAMTRLDDERS
jgi:hypothetical protein